MSQTVSRAITIMKFIAPEPRSLGEVAQRLDVHKSTALRLLQTLEHGGFARQLSDGRYTVGFAIIPLAQHALDQIDVRSIAHTHLQRLAAQEGHTVHLAQLIGDEIIYVDKVEGSGTVAMGSRIGLPAEGHTAGVAKVILAHLDDLTLEKVIGQLSFRRYTSSTIVTPGAFQHELERIRRRGWAEDDGEKEDYINCVALPVPDASGQVRLGMSVTALRVKAPLAELRERIPEFRRVAAAISRDLGWKGDDHVVRR
ncbi:IclR family transcriptional regulator [Aeromicrobium sp. PE09-221]|uniref:IclR family transcriptional regulator n=1 Tax=Aeromicrobium sp. PE09-221 TaxID=1898043 RepID=UPI000B3EBEA2|nr:IclR family transcriptional regulator [Aeromicrobium sp. PE09-221]OUZ11606.1 IclR family transcriptional regulator [Aeromicrobium sp. PE09-221]